MADRSPTVIASDLDGTLLGPDGQLSERTIDVLRAARSAGFLVIAATGRAPTSAMPLLAPHDVVDALICSNGSIVHDVERDETLHRFPIDNGHLDSLFSALDGAWTTRRPGTADSTTSRSATTTCACTASGLARTERHE